MHYQYVRAREAVHFWLYTTPTSFINWQFDNSRRLDITMSAHLNTDYVSDETISTLVPFDENEMLWWGDSAWNAYKGDGRQEHSPSGYLAPYYLAKVYNLV